MDRRIPEFRLDGIITSDMQARIENTLKDNGLYSPDLLFRFYTASRIPTVRATGNDREERGYEKSKLELEAENFGYDMKHTIWADNLDNLQFWSNNGRNLMLLSAISVYEKSKTKSRPELLYGKATSGGGNSVYHVITTDDPRDALVAIFRRNNSPLTHLLGRLHVVFTQGPVALYEALSHDFENARGYLRRR